MIWVDSLFACCAPWSGGLSCHMVSSEGTDDLLSFASSIGIPRHWLQSAASNPHFDLSPRLRAKAVAAGAHECTSRELVQVIRARRARERARASQPALELWPHEPLAGAADRS